MGGLGWQELTIVLVIVIIIFGAGKLPEIGGALGKGIKEFKTQSTDDAGQLDTSSGGTTTAATRIDEPKVVERREMRADEV
ncbi:MAG: Twin-arginine translocation protein TatA [uncultured Thermomicrobiales bacterium]|uniref:Sec-independent protein translocase protein TatA n=1 Tax=uncultured Thermomicrobiales bacterium TaxID=1645740 RepID=A0A6J4U6B0_9BACT|nr:MAG: Twin-arginine translocation protein TatA [uncultured Thermomicrobiales bacterium]